MRRVGFLKVAAAKYCAKASSAESRKSTMSSEKRPVRDFKMQLPTETPQYRRIVSGRSFDSDDDASQIYYGEEEHNTDDELYEVNSNGSGSLHKLSTQLLTEAQTLTK